MESSKPSHWMVISFFFFFFGFQPKKEKLCMKKILQNGVAYNSNMLDTYIRLSITTTNIWHSYHVQLILTLLKSNKNIFFSWIYWKMCVQFLSFIVSGVSLLWVAILGLIVIYIYALIGFAALRAFFAPGEYLYCSTLWQCTVTVIRYGLIGDMFDVSIQNSVKMTVV